MATFRGQITPGSEQHEVLSGAGRPPHALTFSLGLSPGAQRLTGHLGRWGLRDGPPIICLCSQPVIHVSPSILSLRTSWAPGALTTSEVQLLLKQTWPECAEQSERQRLSNSSLEISYKVTVPPIKQASCRGHREPGSTGS